VHAILGATLAARLHAIVDEHSAATTARTNLDLHYDYVLRLTWSSSLLASWRSLVKLSRLFICSSFRFFLDIFNVMQLLFLYSYYKPIPGMTAWLT